MKKETFRKFTLITNEGRYYTNVVAKDQDQAISIIDTYLGPNTWVSKINTEPYIASELLEPTKTLQELKLNERLRKELKEGQLKLISATNDKLYTGSAEYENNGEYILVNFEYDFTYKSYGGDIVPEFSLEVNSIYDYEGDEVTNIDYDIKRLLAEQIAEDINNDYDVERWASWGVDEDRLYFEDTTPDYPITL